MDLQLNEQRIQVAYVYDEKVTLLSSIHESSDSSKSDRSEDGSDSEKKKPISLTDKNEELKVSQPSAVLPQETYSPLFTPPRLNPGYSLPFTPLGRKDFNKTTYIEMPHNNYSECSFDGDTSNEG